MGERVVTSFGRGFIPAIRYRTKDMVLKVPYTKCDCGRTGDIYDGGIRGRWDDMKLIRGTNVYPGAVEAIVREYDAIDEFQIYLWRRDDIRDEVTVKVELKPGREGEWEEIEQKLGTDLANAHEGLALHHRARRAGRAATLRAEGAAAGGRASHRAVLAGSNNHDHDDGPAGQAADRRGA